MSAVPKPGEIYRLQDSEDPRRLVIVSREELNKGDYVVVVPVTSRQYELRRKLPNCVAFRSGEFGFVSNCVAQAEGIQVRDKLELALEEGLLGRLDDARMRDLIRAVGDMMAADCEPGP